MPPGRGAPRAYDIMGLAQLLPDLLVQVVHTGYLTIPVEAGVDFQPPKCDKRLTWHYDGNVGKRHANTATLQHEHLGTGQHNRETL